MRNYYLISILLFMTCGCQTMNSGNHAKLYKNKEIYTEKTDTVWSCAKVDSIWVNGFEDKQGNWVEGYYEYIIQQEGHWGKRSLGAYSQESQSLEGTDKVWHCAKTQAYLVNDYDDDNKLIGERVVHKIIKPGHFGKEISARETY